jgi:AraC-like DNA-binding protein
MADVPPGDGPSSACDQEPVSVLRFDTSEIAPASREAAWRENIGALFDVSTEAGGAKTSAQPAIIAAADVNGTALGLTQAPAQRFSRCARRVATDALGLILIQYFHRGGGLINGQTRLYPGDLLIIDTEQPIDSRLSDFENLSLVIPYALKDRFVPLIERLHAKRVSGDDPLVALLGEHLVSLWRKLPEMNSVQAAAAIRGVLGLLQGWLSADGRLSEEPEPAVTHTLGEAIRCDLEHHLSEPFDVGRLTRRFRISRTQLYRLFAPWGGVASYLWERRLIRSRAMLISPWFQSQSIAAIAFEVGFSSEAHFSRAFRARFGSTPGRARCEAMEAMGQPSGRETASCSNDYPTDIRSLIEGLSTS